MASRKKQVAPRRLTITEDMTIYNAMAQKQQLMEALAGSEELELDLAGVGEIDSTGIQLLILVKREARRQEKAARIVSHSPAVQEVVDFYNLAATFGDPMLIPAAEG